ncbi:hypothetical protein GGR55DRAFT_241482 [Xylaria sp. FL0064]|nr:hypothetical protein GGR55DRAFT_241482 [Xylaria sp. FL0064]
MLRVFVGLVSRAFIPTTTSAKKSIHCSLSIHFPSCFFVSAKHSTVAVLRCLEPYMIKQDYRFLSHLHHQQIALR